MRFLKNFIGRITTRIDRGSLIEKPFRVGVSCRILNSRIGRYTYIGSNTRIYYANIGRFCSIAGNVRIGLGKHPTDFFSTSPVFYSMNNVFGKKWAEGDSIFMEYERTQVGNDVWIGHGAIIPGGIVIGHGAIIAAGAIVTKDVPAYVIVAGVPARILRKRFEEKTIQSLLQTEWWNLDDSQLSELSRFASKPDDFIKELRRR